MIAKLLRFDQPSARADDGATSSGETADRMTLLSPRRLTRARALFGVTVVLPTLAALLYFGFIASDVYVSESQFVVRSPDKPTTSGLGVILKTAGFSNAGDEIYSAQSYVLSRDALRAINKNDAFKQAYSRPSISIFDRFNATGFFGSFEDLFQYYRKKIGIEHDTVSSISTLRVKAYTPEDAVRFNRELLELAESTVNRLNVRGRQDLIRFAQTEVDESEAKSREAALNLARFRNVSGVVDPERQATVQLQMISKLQDELIASRNQLLQLRAFAPANPQVPVLRTKIAGLTRDIDAELDKVAGSSKSLSAAVAQYQRYQLESQVADKQLAGAIASLQDARNEARRKQAYVERIAQPNTPDAALEPRRFRGIIATIIFGLIAYGIVSMLLAGIREHHD